MTARYQRDNVLGITLNKLCLRLLIRFATFHSRYIQFIWRDSPMSGLYLVQNGSPNSCLSKTSPIPYSQKPLRIFPHSIELPLGHLPSIVSNIILALNLLSMRWTWLAHCSTFVVTVINIQCPLNNRQHSSIYLICQYPLSLTGPDILLNIYF